MGHIYNYITSLVILLKSALSLFMSAKHNKNGVMTGTMWNIINSSGISRLTDLIDVVLLISNVKLANLAVFLSSWKRISSYYNALNWPMSFVDQVETSESINNSLNSVSLYRELVDELKI